MIVPNSYLILGSYKSLYNRYINHYIIVPVFGGGPEPTYPESVSPRLTFAPGMFPTNQ